MSAVEPDHAASVLVLRSGVEQFEVLMVKRVERGFFGGLHVFPGGKVEVVDRGSEVGSLIGFEGEDKEFRAAALRELVEEAGLAVLEDGVVPAAGLKDRDALDVSRIRGSRFRGSDLTLISRWVTPEGAPRRFDTWFYLIAVEDTPRVVLDTEELSDWEWVTPQRALHNHETGEWRMFLPTVSHLSWLARRTSIADAIESARGADGRTLIEPQQVSDGSILPIHMPAE